MRVFDAAVDSFNAVYDWWFFDLSRRWKAAGALVVIALVGAITFWQLGADSGSKRQDALVATANAEKAAPGLTTSAPGGDSVATASDINVTTVATTAPSSTTTETTTTKPTQQSSLSPVPSAEDEAPQVVSIQTVPVVRDLIVEIDGRRVATDARGAIDLNPDDFDAKITVIGVTAVPALSEVEFVQWSDGNTDRIRSAAGMPGPVIQLGLRVSNRVIVEIDGSAPPAAFITFISDQVGQFAVPVGEPTFLVSQQARPIDGALIVETVEYTVDASQGDYATTTFRASPESLWRITD
ncbi:MAG: hypothetical protein ABIO83_05345 [Ilumatobacteraceae bacterium]